MKDKWDDLLKVLKEMLSIYQEILLLSQQKQQILIAAKSHDLETVTKEEEILIVQIGKLEGLRSKIVSELLAEHGITENQDSLTELCKIATPDVEQQLANFGKDFGTIVSEMEPINALNTELIKQSLNFINYNINLLSQAEAGTTYVAKGHTNQQVPKRTVFDARV